MHSSVRDAKAHRDLENSRRATNRIRFQANKLMKFFGLDPAFTPSPFGESRAVRQETSRPLRQIRRMEKFFTIWTLYYR